MTFTKKQILFGIIAIIIVASLAVGGAFALRMIKKTDSTADTSTTAPVETAVEATEEKAAAAVDAAKAARAAGKYDEAIGSYQKARSYYQASKSEEKTADIDAALSLLEVEKKRQQPATIKAPLAGQE
jgi:hypothetical protein